MAKGAKSVELKHLKTFVVVSEIRSFTKAAELLGYVQSNVTAQIRALEEELAVPLFDRLGKTVVLTDFGRRLLPQAQEMLRLQSAIVDLVQEEARPSGTLTIGAPESLATYRLPKVIQAYKRLYPQVKIILKPGPCWELRNEVRHGHVDFAFLLEDEAQISDLLVEKLVEEPIVLVAPVDHLLVKKDHIEPIDLQNETLVHTEPDCSYRGMFDLYLQKNGITPSAMMEFWNIEAIKNCVISGLGLSVLPRVAVEAELKAGKLAELRWDDSAVRVCTQLIRHKSKWESPAMREFLRILREHASSWSNAQREMPLAQ